MASNKITSLEYQAGKAAASLLNGPLLGPNFFLEMVKTWNFPPLIDSPQRALIYLDAFRDHFVAEAPVQDAISSADLWLRQQTGGPF